MSSGPTYVRIGAETTDLTAKLAVAKADFSAFSKELRVAAEQMRAAGAGASEQMRTGLANAAKAAAQARTEINALNHELRETQNSGGGLNRMATQFEEMLAPISNVRNSLGMIAEATAAAFAVEQIGEFIEKTAEAGANLVKLHEQTGVGIEKLSGWHYAADQMDVSAESLDSSIKKLGRSVQEALIDPSGKASMAFHAMGIEQGFLRSNSNDLSAVLMKMSGAFQEHADGMQADAIAQATLGRGGVELLSFLRQGPEAIQKMVDRQRELGAQWTGPMAEAMLEHRRAVKDLSTAWEGFGISITNSTAGPLTALLKWTTSMITGLREANAEARRFQEQLAKNIAPGMYVQNAPMAGKLAGSAKWGAPEKPQFPDFNKPAKEKSGGASKVMQEYKDEITQQLLAMQVFGDQAKAFELEFWQAKLQIAQAGGTKYADVAREIREKVYSLEADAANQAKRLDDQAFRQRVEGWRRSTEEIKAQIQETSRDFDQYANDLRDTISESYRDQIAEAAGSLAEQRRLAEQWLAEMKTMFGDNARNHKAAADEIRRIDKAQVEDQLQPWKTVIGGIGSGFRQMFNGVLQGTQSFRQMMANMASNLLATFANVAIQAAETWAISQIRQVLVHQQGEATKTASTAAGEATRTGIKTAAAAEGQAVEAAAGSASVLGDAYKAAAGAYSAVAGIPYIGPILAPAAAGVAFAAVSAFDIFSAAGGMDIGPGMNPLVQAHAEEMVLPAQYANVIRGLGEKSGGGDTHVHLNYQSSGGKESDHRDHAREMVDIIKHQIRIGALKLSPA
jgi:hypothetical protein